MKSTSQDLSGYGIPTKSTVGNIGDIYTDLNTEIKYKCVAAFSYTGHNSMTVEYIWKKTFSISSDGSTEGIHLIDTLTNTEYMLLVSNSKLAIAEVE